MTKTQTTTHRPTSLWSRVTGFTSVTLLLALQGSWTAVGVPPSTLTGLHLPFFSLDSGQEAAPSHGLPEYAHLYRIPVLVTGYSSTPEETDEDPFVTASNKCVQLGYIALSRDLLRSYTPGAPFNFGDEVEVLGVGVFQVEDTMNPRYRMRADIWFEDKEAAVAWGSRRLVLGRLVAGPSHGSGDEGPRADGLLFNPAPPDQGLGPVTPGA